MSLESPFVLLALITLPLVLAWLGRRAPRIAMNWPSLRFLPELVEPTRERRGLAMPPLWVILTAGSIGSMVVAIARPLLDDDKEPAGITVLFDVTASMAWRDPAGRTRWRVALDRTLEELASEPRGRITWRTYPDLSTVAVTEGRADRTRLEALLTPRCAVAPAAVAWSTLQGERVLFVTDGAPTSLPADVAVRETAVGGGTNAGIVSAACDEDGTCWIVVHVAGDAPRDVWLADRAGTAFTERVRIEPGGFHTFQRASAELRAPVSLRTNGEDALALDDWVQEHASGPTSVRLAFGSTVLERVLASLSGFRTALEGEDADVVVTRGAVAHQYARAEVRLEAGDGEFAPGSLLAQDVPDRETFSRLEPLPLAVRSVHREGARVLFSARMEDGRVVPVIVIEENTLLVGISLDSLEAHRQRYHVPLLFALSLAVLRERLVQPGFPRMPVADGGGCQNLLALAETDQVWSSATSTALREVRSENASSPRGSERPWLIAALILWLLGPCLRLLRARPRPSAS